VCRIGVLGDIQILLNDAPRIGQEGPMSSDVGMTLSRVLTRRAAQRLDSDAIPAWRLVVGARSQGSDASKRDSTLRPLSQGPRSEQKHGESQGHGVDREADGTDGDGASVTRIVEGLTDRDDHGDEHPDCGHEEYRAGDW
jgi:hypothetical protein